VGSSFYANQASIFAHLPNHPHPSNGEILVPGLHHKIMSYDYNALVSQINTFRRQTAEATSAESKLENLQGSVEVFATLSGYCPMTPLLWMQYSQDTADLLLCLSGETEPSETTAASARSTQLQLLEIALSEFPGSAILHVHYLQILHQATENTYDKMDAALTSALTMVGRGSHRNEGVLVAEIYRLAVSTYSMHGEMDKALTTFVRRAETPMKDANDSLAAEFLSFCSNHPEIPSKKKQDTLADLDRGRRYESRTFHALIDCEDEVDIAMHNESILPRHQVDLEQLPWETILQSDGKLCWMGYGGALSANAFIQYAKTCTRHRIRVSGGKKDLSQEEQEQIRQDEASIHELVVCIYERAVAECPTVETVWLKYVRHLQYLVGEDKSQISNLKSVVERSLRNCPYSMQLAQQKILLQGFLSEEGVAILDPDELQKIVEETINSKFMPSKEACLDLYMTAARVLRRRLLFVMAKACVASESKSTTIHYDEPQAFIPGKYSFDFPEFDDETGQELEDLCDDCRDFYDAIDAYLKKNHASWSEGRWRLMSERSYVDVHLLGPLAASLADESSSTDGQIDRRFEETIRSYDKLIKIYQPTPPDSYMEYIQTFLSAFPVTKPSSVISKIRQVRFLFQRAIQTLGRPKNPTAPLDPAIQRDFDSGLRNLCHHYLIFERYFGSEKSMASTSMAVQKKLAKFAVDTTKNPEPPVGTEIDDTSNVEVEVASSAPPGILAPSVDTIDAVVATSKRDSSEDGSGEEPPAKRVKMNIQSTPSTNSKQVHKAKIGNVEYPAHAFTVRISNLAPQVEDMDLVNTFRPRCGAIVHARIMREKQTHHHNGKGQSKGWGLIQFELEESVDKALALSNIIGMSERLVNVERSHMPAVSLVPPGMHRVKPNGEGRNTKLNQKKKLQRDKQAEKGIDHCRTTTTEGRSEQNPEPDVVTKPVAASSSSNAVAGVLAFRPRGVQRKQTKKPPKMRLSLGDDGKDESK